MVFQGRAVSCEHFAVLGGGGVRERMECAAVLFYPVTIADYARAFGARLSPPRLRSSIIHFSMSETFPIVAPLRGATTRAASPREKIGSIVPMANFDHFDLQNSKNDNMARKTLYNVLFP